VAVIPGASASVDMTVDDADTAVALRSGAVPVLATSRVVAICDAASAAAVSSGLEPTETTVGQRVHIEHLAPVAVGGTVRAEAVVEKVEGRRLTFTVTVKNDRGLVAAGRVTRVIVDIDRFMERAH
jgi:predicted thioesterase